MKSVNENGRDGVRYLREMTVAQFAAAVARARKARGGK
jgi:hypothetical protein